MDKLSEQRDTNPYPGPRPFEQTDRALFFGRERERRELVSLVVAHRLVLLYAASGAGKTSLLNAGVIPALEEEEGFEVLPPLRIRPSGDAFHRPEGANAFLFSVLTNLARDLRLDLDSSDLAAASLAGFLARIQPRRSDRGIPDPRVLIFDQFEELFTVHPEFWSHREAFVGEIVDVLEGDGELEPRRVVLAMREDHLAELAPYARLMPDGFRIRRRLERLEKEPALRAVTRPLEGTGRAFGTGVAETLVEDLLKQRIERRESEKNAPDPRRSRDAAHAAHRPDTPGGRSILIEGQFVEPVQLQVVCSTLWDHLPANVTQIEHRHVQSFGNVDQVLGRFYDDAVGAAVRAARVREQRLRQWIESALITPGGTRGTVYRGASTTAGLPNAAIDALESKRLIRAEWRAGAAWYELTHDRLIEPIRASNRRYAHQRQRRIVRAATVVALASAVIAAAVVVPLVALAGGTTSTERRAAAPTPTFFDFGRTLVGEPQETSVALHAGSAPLAISSVTIRRQLDTDPNAFQRSLGTCPVGRALDAGESCTLHVTFSPTSEGPKAATLRIRSESGDLLETRLRGTGSYLTVTPDVVDFGRASPGSFRNEDLVLANAKQAFMLRTTAEVSPADVFEISFNSCGTLNPGTSCTLTVSFVALGAGRRKGVLTIRRSVGAPIKVPLSGRVAGR